jgi:hypothetical protein
VTRSGNCLSCYSSTSFASRRRSRGSVGERPLHTRKVAGSIPAGTTHVHADKIGYLALRNKCGVISVLSRPSRLFDSPPVGYDTQRGFNGNKRGAPAGRLAFGSCGV